MRRDNSPKEAPERERERERERGNIIKQNKKEIVVLTWKRRPASASRDWAAVSLPVAGSMAKRRWAERSASLQRRERED